jgi:Heparinase II/III-like protein/Heparinase II/III N-terminus
MNNHHSFRNLLHYSRVVYYRLVKPRLWRWFVERWTAHQKPPITTPKPLFFNDQDYEAISEQLLTFLSDETIRRQATDALDHRFAIFSSTARTHGADIHWHKDYASGYEWSVQPAWTIDFMQSHTTQNGISSDVKYPWELSRHHWFSWFGLAYVLENNSQNRSVWANAFGRDVRSWQVANPLGMGINWAMPMEVAIRATNWILAHSFFYSAPECTSEFWESFTQTLWQHGCFLEYNLEFVRHNANHFTSNAMGLVVLGAFFYETRRGKRWFRAGKRFLESEILRQVYDDGVNYEKSTSYHRFVAEMLDVAAVAAERIKQPFSNQYYERLSRMYVFMEAYTRADGTAPQWGDNDNGRVIRLFASEDFSKHLQNKQLNDILLQQVIKPISLAEVSQNGEMTFPRGGFIIHRTEQTHLLMDVGDYGMDGWGGHGHNDCLAFEFWLCGAPLFVDSGTGTYTANTRLRNELRSTQAHNTVMVRNTEQTAYGSGLWRIARDELQPRFETTRFATETLQTSPHTATEQRFAIRASHAGYASRFGLMHTRNITLRTFPRIDSANGNANGNGNTNGELIITDTLLPTEPRMLPAYSSAHGKAYYRLGLDWNYRQESPFKIRLTYNSCTAFIESCDEIIVEPCRISYFYGDVRNSWCLVTPCSVENAATIHLHWHLYQE